MAEPENYYDEYEIDLREYIMLLWKKKWFIISLFVIVVLAVGIYSMFMVESVYEARSSLLIMPPTYTTSLDVSTLPVNTYENIALTDTIKQDIIDELDLKKSDGSSYTPENLENMMALEIKSRSVENNDEEKQYPFFVMKVKNNDPELASKIANTWANKFMEASKEIRKGEVKEVTDVIIEQFEDTEEELTTAREELKDFKKDARLSLKNTKLETMKSKFSNYEEKLITLNTDLGSEESKYEDFLRQIDKLEEDDEWKGQLDNEGKILTEAKENYLEAQQNLLNFRQNNDKEILQKEIDVEIKKLEKYNSEKINLEAELSANSINKRKELENELEKMKEEKKNLEREIEIRTKDGEWVGIFDNDENSQNKKEEIISAKNNFSDSQQKIIDFKRDNNLSLLRQDISLNKSKLKNYKEKSSNLENELENIKIENQKIKDLLDDENDTKELKRSLTNDAFWNNILSEEKINTLKDLKLTNEIVNPIYEELRTRYTNNQIKLESYPEQINYYEKEIATLENDLKEKEYELDKKEEKLSNLQKNLKHHSKIYDEFEESYRSLFFELENINLDIASTQKRLEHYRKFKSKDIKEQIAEYDKLITEQKDKINNLNNKLYSWENEEEKLQSDLDNYRKIYENEASVYRSLISDKLKSEMKIDSLNAQIDFYEGKVNGMESDIKSLQDEIWEAEIKKEELSQRVTDIENTYSMLSEKVEEARLTEAQRSSDVKFIAEAVPPTQPISSNTKLNVAIAGVLALMLGVFIVFFREFLKEDKNEEEEITA